MIKEAQKRQAKYELNNIKFRHGSMEETELEAGTFDLIYAISSLNKDNYETTFDEALRLLKRGGRMCALYPGINLSIPRVAVDRGMKVEVKKSDTVVKAGKVSYSFMCAEKA
jgi:ubiquinone/menaquinone biosynthesis C-methylase UbiE